MTILPTVKIKNIEVTRLIIGGNPFSGFSHQSNQVDEEMMDFYSTERIKETLLYAQSLGINTFAARGDRHILRVLRECANEGKLKLQWICQTVPELGDFKNMIGAIVSSKYKPVAIYHHGGHADRLYLEGKMDVLKDNLKIMRDTGFLVGLASHIPEVIKECEDAGLDIDFYMACFYNLTGRGKKGLTVFSGSEGEVFDDEDPVKMCQVIREVPKTCIAYKILGAGRKAKNSDELVNSFKFAFQNIKVNDCVCVGVFQKYKDQLKENVEIVRKILA